MSTRLQATGPASRERDEATDRQPVDRTARDGDRPVADGSRGGRAAQSVRRLQERRGNRAVQRLVADGALRPKLEVGPPDDRYEREADRVAEAVVRLSDAEVRGEPAGPATANPDRGPAGRRSGGGPERGGSAESGGAPERVQRLCTRCRNRYRQGKPLNCDDCEEELRRKPDAGSSADGATGDDARRPGRSGDGAAGGGGRRSGRSGGGDGRSGGDERRAGGDHPGSGRRSTAADLDDAVRSVRGGGRPLPPSTRSYFEPRFDREFGDVRLHTGPRSDEVAGRLGARAFAVGRDVVVRSDEYRPGTRGGRRLLAHELAHVVQQTGPAPAAAGRSPDADAPGRRPAGDRDRRARLSDSGVRLARQTDEGSEPATGEAEQPTGGGGVSGFVDTVTSAAGAVAEAIGDTARATVDPMDRVADEVATSVEITAADVTDDSIDVELSGLELSGQLTLELVGETDHTLRSEERPPGTHEESFDVESLPDGEYTDIRATWEVDEASAEATLPYRMRVLGTYRHTQYNIPSEADCGGADQDVYITDGDCNFTEGTLGSTFVREVNENGSGISEEYGNVRRDGWCLDHGDPPEDAEDRSFRQVGAFSGSCGGATGGGRLGNDTVARPRDHPHLGCGDRVYINTVGTKRVTDLCPGCAEQQLDNFTTDRSCSGITDVGNHVTIKLFP